MMDRFRATTFHRRPSGGQFGPRGGMCRPIIDSRSAELIAWRRSVEPAQCHPNDGRRAAMGWSRLLKRVFDIDMQHGPNCGAGELKIIVAVFERPVIHRGFGRCGLTGSRPH
jgi:hypothetical protein